MLRLQELDVYTDHLALLYKPNASPRVAWWRVLLGEYSPRVYHLPGEGDKAADAISRLGMMQHGYEGESEDWGVPNPPLHYQAGKVKGVSPPMTPNEGLIGKEPPMAPVMVENHQGRDRSIGERFGEKGWISLYWGYWGYGLLHYNGKTHAPPTLQARVLDWYHHCMLAHPLERQDWSKQLQVYFIGHHCGEMWRKIVRRVLNVKCVREQIRGDTGR